VVCALHEAVRMNLGRLSFVLLAATSACSKAADKPTAAADSSAAVAAPAPPPVAKPGTLNVAALPALGAADAIEPPSRDIVPGMSIADALAKGAKRDTVDYTLTWKQDVLDLWIAKESNLVTSVEATYKAPELTALSAKWGKQSWGDDAWIGANWLARLNGCQAGECTVSFTRSPMVFLGAAPEPPLGLARLTTTSTRADAERIAGVPLKDRSGVETGFALSLGLDAPDAGPIESIVVDSRSGGDGELYAAALEKAWGKRVARGDALAWFSKDGRWAVETGKYGDTVRYTPILRAADELAQLRALPAKLWHKPKAAVAAAMPDQKDDHLDLAHDEWSYGGDSSAGGAVAVYYDDKGTVDELHIEIAATAETMAAATAAFEAAFGKPTKVEDGLKLTVDGVPFTVTYDEISIRLSAVTSAE
jgi:hypothetical protein